MVRITTKDREAAVVRYVHLNGGPAGVTVREIWEGLRDPGELGDHVTLQAYHGVVDRLVGRAVLVAMSVPAGAPNRYAVADAWRVSLEDIEDGLRREYEGAGDGIVFNSSLSLDPGAYAKYLDGQLVFREEGLRVLRLAVTGLLQEDPVDLVLRMLQDKVADLNRLVDGLPTSSSQSRDEQKSKVEARFRGLRTLVHSHYGLSCLHFPTGSSEEALRGKPVSPDWGVVRNALERRVFGESAIFWVRVGDKDSVERPFVIGGSDGSSHSMNVSGFPGAGFSDDDAGLVLTFNNALAALQLPDSLADHFEYPYHSVPLNRAAFENPENFAMVMARIWFPDLTDAGYEHLKQAALELVQCQVDERVVSGVANVMGDGTLLGRGRRMMLPRPVVHFRDGLVTPQVRELMWHNYCDEGVSGEFYRRIMTLWLNMLQSVAGSDRQVLVGVVKSTQMRAFSELVNWYVTRGSANSNILDKNDGEPIAPEWNNSDFWLLSDHQVMTQLLAAAELELDGGNRMKAGDYLCSFAILRPFPQLDGDLRYREVSDDGWVSYFEDLRDKESERRCSYGGDLHYLETVTVADEPYVQMCRKADYVSFYVGHTAGSPAPQLPRYEFMDTLRALGDLRAMRDRVSTRVRLIVEALHDGELAQDRDHSFMLDRQVVRLLPFVVYDAHEKSKVWGSRLSTEFRAAVFERLAEIRGGGGSQRDLIFEPIPAREYIKRVAEVLKPVEASEQGKLFDVSLLPVT